MNFRLISAVYQSAENTNFVEVVKKNKVRNMIDYSYKLWKIGGSMTKVYGASDDLIEIEGEVESELGSYNEITEIKFSDGTIINMWYGKEIEGIDGKEDIGVWSIQVLEEGSCFQELQICEDEDADICSDILIFKDGVKTFTSSVL